MIRVRISSSIASVSTRDGSAWSGARSAPAGGTVWPVAKPADLVSIGVEGKWEEFMSKTREIDIAGWTMGAIAPHIKKQSTLENELLVVG